MTKLSARYFEDNPVIEQGYEVLSGSDAKQSQICARCNVPIHDEFITSVLNRLWHEKCLRCVDCEGQLTDTCYARNGNTYCREDFYRRFAPRCAGCGVVFHPTDLVRKAKDAYFHVICFVCATCGRQLHTGDQLFIVGENTFVCKEDYLTGNHSGATILNEYGDDDGDDDFEDEDAQGEGLDIMRRRRPSSQSVGGSRDSPTTSTGRKSNGINDGQIDSEDGAYDDPEKKKDDNGNKRRGPRTTIKAKQLEVLKTAFSQTPKPTRHIREQLAKDTGLPMRVIQVWFQNKRSKERRLKQMCSRSKFFMGPHGHLKMRKFGVDDGRFYFFEGRPEFGYPYPGDFFPPPPHGMPFPGPSNSLMDPSIPMSMLHQPPVPSHLIDSPDEDVFGVPPPPDGFMGSMMRAQSLGNTDSENEALPLTIKTEIDDGRIRQGSNSSDAW